MYDDSPQLEAITERDIDLLLMEELVSGSGFLQWFVERTTRWPVDELNLIGTWHSVSTNDGESDLLVQLCRPDQERLALLIENKVDAPPQPEQAIRYERRGQIGVAQGTWKEFITCLVAPQRYLGAAANAAAYHAQIGYEEIAEWMQKNLPPGGRTEFKRSLILAAIEQQRRGYSPKMDPAVSRFFTEYWELAETLFPELRFCHLETRPANSTWAEFRPSALPKGRQLLHKLPNGCVDLQLSGLGARVDELNALNAPLCVDELKFAPAMKSAALRVEVPKMNVREDFSAQRDAALAALKAAYKLSWISPLLRMPQTAD